MKKILAYVLLSIALISCTKTPEDHKVTYLDGNGAFIINEGNFLSGNGSVSFFSYDSADVYNDLFELINERPLGDVPNSMVVHGNFGYIVVNNSGKIEVVDRNTFKTIASIDGLVAPRNIAFVNSEKAYITSMYSDSIAILRVSDNKITGYINIRRSSESIEIASGKAFVSNWIGGEELIVINTTTDKVQDSIKVGVEPESMVVDKNGQLWVLCNGGWMRLNYAKLISINTNTNKVEKELVFPTKQASPVCLNISGDGTTLFYLEGGVRKMKISAGVLPQSPFIAEQGTYFYKLGVNPVNDDIFVTDAIDYQQTGYVMRYSKEGVLQSKLRAGIIPGMICFKMNDN